RQALTSAKADVRLGRPIMTRPVPFEFADVDEARTVARLLRRQAQAFQMLAGRLTGPGGRRLLGTCTGRARHRLAYRHGGRPARPAAALNTAAKAILERRAEAFSRIALNYVRPQGQPAGVGCGIILLARRDVP